MTDTRTFVKLKKRSVWKKRKDYDHLKTFGASIVPLPEKLLFLSKVLDQGPTEKCTAYTAAAVRASMKGKEYDPEFHWREELKLMGVTDANGADLETPMKVGVKTGFLRVGDTVPTDKAKAYFAVNRSFGLDWFDAVRHTINDIQAPLSVGVMWFEEWDHTPQGIIPHTRNVLLGGHDTKIAGFETLNGVDYLTIQGSWGEGYGDKGLFRFDRFMTNLCFTMGIFYWSDVDIPDPQRQGFIRAIIVQLISLYKQLLLVTPKQTAPPVPAPEPTPQPMPTSHVSKINDWALAIQAQEGWVPGSVSFRHNNPGNLKYSSLTASWGATQGHNAADGGSFCQFPDYATGFKALCNFLTLGAEDQLLAFHQARTLRQFTKVYANPPDDGYANRVANSLKVAVDIDVSQLL